MTQFFFSVDVETSSTNPFTGELLTVAIIPIRTEPWEIMHGKHWALEFERGNCDFDTVKWWSEQNEEAYNAAWGGLRLNKQDAAENIHAYVTSFAPDDVHDRVFAANPASFDWAWIEKLFSNTGVPNPFSHRTLCMRSVRYGIEGGTWGLSRYKEEKVNYSKIPHHAYWDALAQAKDLEYIISMMKKDKGGAKSMGRVPIDLNKPTWEIHSRGYEAGQVHPDWNS